MVGALPIVEKRRTSVRWIGSGEMHLAIAVHTQKSHQAHVDHHNIGAIILPTCSPWQELEPDSCLPFAPGLSFSGLL